MIIFLSELQKDHLSLLQKHSTQVLIDFCKLAIDYLNNGINEKKYGIAAEKLGVSVVAVQNLVHALLYLIVEACKHKLSEPDFKSSLGIAGFSEEQQDVLVKLYSAKNAEISSSLSLLQQREPSYQDFTWRFEVQVATKSCMEEIKPMISMNFTVTTPKNFGQTEQIYNIANDMNAISPVHINSSIQEAKTSSHCQNIISHHLLQCDLPNLINMTNVLEQALKESKSQHVRKVQRVL
ncbi:COMM domain-containing protein 2 [Amyelois transitella]|uniref:COMM domain-containing protein 2 n=1 Tax=Amyelois transitella TaxID=680683 RepID=UPI00299022BA|nr:COMM domain-containing protein 2 [Amyelois transitella]